MKNKKGFSFIEIICVISLIFLLTSFGYPVISKWKENKLLENNYVVFEELIMKAKFYAKLLDQAIQINFDELKDQNKVILIAGISQTNNCNDVKFMKTIIEQSFSRNLFFDNKNFCFFPNGNSSGGKIKMGNNEKQIIFTINNNTSYVEKTIIKD